MKKFLIISYCNSASRLTLKRSFSSTILHVVDRCSWSSPHSYRGDKSTRDPTPASHGPRPIVILISRLPSIHFSPILSSSQESKETRDQRILKSDKMAANTRYQAAPQRDSFEDQHYTQAPPSYQATAEPAEPLEPRTENDNLPDDFKVCRIFRRYSLINDKTRTKDADHGLLI
jgi:hypothetical protein